MPTMSNPQIIKKNAPLSKNLLRIQSVKDIQYGMVLYIDNEGSDYHLEVMRKQYPFENRTEFQGYLDYVAIKVREKKCFMLSEI